MQIIELACDVPEEKKTKDSIQTDGYENAENTLARSCQRNTGRNKILMITRNHSRMSNHVCNNAHTVRFGPSVSGPLGLTTVSDRGPSRRWSEIGGVTLKVVVVVVVENRVTTTAAACSGIFHRSEGGRGGN